ncbi:MAG: MoxR family ATPase [Gemmatimonadaceae bacterium]
MTDLTATSATLQRIRETVGARVLGQEDVIDQILAAFVARGHVLLEGVPGTAKTLLVRVLAGALDVRFGRVQFTPDLMPSDVAGVSVYQESTHSFEFRAGPIFTDLLLADEINRAPAKTQAALLEAMQERQVTVDGVTHSLGDLFSVFATQNPVEYEGTYPLPEAQLDRFLVNVRVNYPAKTAELAMLENYSKGFDAERADTFMPTPVVTRAEVLQLRTMTDNVNVTPEVREYITDIVRATREDTSLTLGASPRAAVALFRIARAAALVAGRDFATPDDVKQHALPVLRHRVLLAPELQVEGRSTDDVINSILARVPAPK